MNFNTLLCRLSLESSDFVNDHDIVEINCFQTDHNKDTLRIIKTRFKCRECEIAYTPSINGIAEPINNNLKTMIKVSYDYHSFERFRRKCILISRFKKIQILV